MTIRRARPDDAAALQEILYETFESTWRPAVGEAAAQAFLDQKRPARYVGERGLLFWVAELDGAPAGLLDVDGDFVNALHVRPRFARQGIGARLMDHAEALIAQAGFATARLETDTFNRPARTFYAARGYREAGRYPDTEWGGQLTTLLLEKRLG